ncbi:MAG TPA: hypothetical protein VHY30_03800 [Verrucomicrobiae bacterium]|jgi:hypothetical protein|nr:hypothetical protein [Verrucomicrobiae bacterium]
MKIRQIIPILLLIIYGVGCESVQPIAENTQSIVIKKPANRPIGLGRSFDFPIGVYVPDFQTKEGIYYLAPTKLIVNALGTHRPRRGGLFVPSQNSSDKRQAAWLDQEEDSGVLTAGFSSTTSLWRFDEPVSFEIQNP